MNHTWNPTQNTQTDVDQKVGAASRLEKYGDEGEQDSEEVEKSVRS